MIPVAAAAAIPAVLGAAQGSTAGLVEGIASFVPTAMDKYAKERLAKLKGQKGLSEAEESAMLSQGMAPIEGIQNQLESQAKATVQDAQDIGKAEGRVAEGVAGSKQQLSRDIKQTDLQQEELDKAEEIRLKQYRSDRTKEKVTGAAGIVAGGMAGAQQADSKAKMVGRLDSYELSPETRAKLEVMIANGSVSSPETE